MSDFDPLRAQRDIVAGALDVLKVVQQEATEAEQQFSEAEARLNAMRKVLAFAKETVERERLVLRQLEQEAEGDGKP